jgi:hypothetical protein
MCPRCGVGFISKAGAASICSYCSFTWPGEPTDEMLEALKYAFLSNGSYRQDHPGCALMNDLRENDASIRVQAGTARIRMDDIVDDFCRIDAGAGKFPSDAGSL